VTRGESDPFAPVCFAPMPAWFNDTGHSLSPTLGYPIDARVRDARTPIPRPGTPAFNMGAPYLGYGVSTHLPCCCGSHIFPPQDNHRQAS
jgi:hypothetical protein